MAASMAARERLEMDRGLLAALLAWLLVATGGPRRSGDSREAHRERRRAAGGGW